MMTKNNRVEAKMNNEERRLLMATLAEMRAFMDEMRELKGEMKEFKEHVIGRVERLEKREGDRGRNLLTVISIFIATGALVVNFVFNFLKMGGM